MRRKKPLGCDLLNSLLEVFTFRLMAFFRLKNIVRFVGWFSWQSVVIPYGDDIAADRWAKKMKRLS